MLSSNNLLKDIQAGIVVFFVALPLCMGIAIAQDLPPISGIISGIIGGTIVMLLSGSKYSITGPAAGLTAIVLTMLSDLGSFPLMLTALIVAGAIQVLLGLVKAGVIGHYFPSSVIKGMLSAIGLILIFKQIPHLVGYNVDPECDMSFFQQDGRNTFSELFNMIDYMTPGPTIISLTSIAILIFWNKKQEKSSSVYSFLPSALIVVSVGIILNLFFKYYYPLLFVYQSHLVTVPTIKSSTDLITSLTFPDLAGFYSSKTYVIAFTLAIVASLETLLSIDATDKLKKANKPSPTNRELIAQGVGNMTCGLIGGIPITSVIVRSSANINAGATSKRSGYIHAILLIVSVLFFPNILRQIPNASLAVILLFTGYKLTQIGLYKSMFQLGIKQFLPFITTILVMIITDMLKGILCGLLIAIYFIIRDMMRIPIKSTTADIHGTPHTLITFPENVSFINKGALQKMLNNVPSKSILILDGANIKSIDYDILETIALFKVETTKREIKTQFINIQEVNLHLQNH